MLSYEKVIETRVFAEPFPAAWRPAALGGVWCFPEAAAPTPRRFGARINRVDHMGVQTMAILIDSDTRVVVQLELGPAGTAGSRTLRISDITAPARRATDFVSAMRRVEEEVYGAA